MFCKEKNHDTLNIEGPMEFFHTLDSFVRLRSCEQSDKTLSLRANPQLPAQKPCYPLFFFSSIPIICSFQHDLTLPFLLGRSAPRSSHHRAAGTDCGSHEFSPCLHFNLSSHPDQLSPALGSTSEKTLTPRWCPGSDTGQGWPEERFAELSLDSCMSASGISS